jgi:hypothetical protein
MKSSIHSAVVLIALTAIAFLVCSQPAAALPIKIFNTGVDDSYNILAPGMPDPHWTVGAGQAYVLSLMYGLWLPNGPDSMWIGYQDDFSQPQAPYPISQQFDLTGFDPSTAQISGAWGIDDYGVIALNGIATASND